MEQPGLQPTMHHQGQPLLLSVSQCVYHFHSLSPSSKVFVSRVPLGYSSSVHLESSGQPALIFQLQALGSKFKDNRPQAIGQSSSLPVFLGY